MMRSLSIGATGMLAQQLNVEVISNNLANMSTTGFKRQRAEFQDLLYENLKRMGTTSSDAGTVIPSGIQLGTGVKTGSVYRIMGQGNMNMTENTYDLGIQGEGYFRIQLPSGDEAYTRSGALQLNGNGELVTQDGYVVQPGIVIPANAVEVSISASGEVAVTLTGQVAPQVVGQLDLATFINPAGLEATGNNLFLETPASGTPTIGIPGSAGYGTLLQGYVEVSNVNPVQEITNLISAQRAYELNSKVITASDEMLQTITQLR